MPKYIGIEISDEGNISVGWRNVTAQEVSILLIDARNIVMDSVKKSAIITADKLPFDPKIVGRS